MMGCIQSSQSQDRSHFSQGNHGSTSNRSQLPRHYDVKEYTAVIEDAIKMVDVDLLLSALIECTTEQKAEISTNYNTTHGSILLADISGAFSQSPAWVPFTAELLLLLPWQSCAGYLCQLLSGEIIREKTVIETICCQNDDNLVKVKAYYEEISARNTSLESDLQAKCSPEVSQGLCAYMLEKSLEEPADITRVVSEVIQATRDGNLFTGDKVFYSILQEFPRNSLAAIFEQFLKQCQRDISVEIEKNFPPGRVQDGLKILVSVIRTPRLHVAERLNQLLRECTDPQAQMELCYILLTHSQDALRELKQTYKNSYFEMLSRDVRQEITDPSLQRLLAQVIK